MGQRNFDSVTIVQSDTVIYDPPLQGIVISAVGNLAYEDDRGTHTLAVPAVAAGGSLPYHFPVRIRRVLAATTIADADLMGLI